jgi:hypothetical protein
MTARRSRSRELAIGLGAYAAYLGVRRLVLRRGGRERAARNAERVVSLERRVGVAVEPALQRSVLRAPRAVHALNAGYALANVMLSIGLLLRMYRQGDPRFARERRAAAAAFLGALPVFLAFPTAPPRTRDEFVDTLADGGIDIEHPLLVRFYNPVAAMPSLHVAFAVVTSVGHAHRAATLGRALWPAYAPAVSLVVVATGNHYVLDVAGGAALGLAARAFTR